MVRVPFAVARCRVEKGSEAVDLRLRERTGERVRPYAVEEDRAVHGDLQMVGKGAMRGGDSVRGVGQQRQSRAKRAKMFIAGQGRNPAAYETFTLHTA
ncbi:MAG: hypothetical protein DI549_21175 [Ancylobacter novellus]|uniref:Uncharacterized protein n=1 Tax=Ancylobacter novellus TaxID=921 RepID=A0A2W5QQ69_ANCNO|nr:MAG: hypothetical protein DI549_21175 [Ancylobacter novellus]